MQVRAGNGKIRFPMDLFPTEGFKGIHDDPVANVLVIRDDIQIAIVSIEIVMLWDDFLVRLREAVASATGTKIENVWIQVTHVITTPHAPGGPKGVETRAKADPKEEAERTIELKKRKMCEDAVFDAVMDAIDNSKELADARLFVGTSKCSLIQGRDIETPNGYWIGENGQVDLDSLMTVLTFKDMSDKIICSVICYGMKPCVIDNSEKDSDNRLISADAPGFCCRQLEKKFGAPMLYFMGAAGDRMPIKLAWFDTTDAKGEIITVDHGVEKGLEWAFEIGNKMALTASDIILHSEEERNAMLDMKRTSYSWPSKGRLPMHPYKEIEFAEDGSKEVPIDVITLGDVALVGGRPEMNAITERQLRERSGFKHTLYVAMVNGGMKYMPDKESYEKITWEALSAMLMPGAAEKFVEEAEKLLN